MVVFLCFGSCILVYSNFKIKIRSNELTKLRSENLWKLRTAIINSPVWMQLIICQKKAPFFAFSSIKLVLIRKVLTPVQTCLYLGWIAFESDHELLINLNSTFAKSMNLNVLINHSKNLIFSNQNLHCESSDL